MYLYVCVRIVYVCVYVCMCVIVCVCVVLDPEGRRDLGSEGQRDLGAEGQNGIMLGMFISCTLVHPCSLCGK